MVARGGIEPPTRGFSVRRGITNHLNNQSLAALATPHSSLFQAHIGHTQSGSGTAGSSTASRSIGSAFVRIVTFGFTKLAND